MRKGNLKRWIIIGVVVIASAIFSDKIIELVKKVPVLGEKIQELKDKNNA